MHIAFPGARVFAVVSCLFWGTVDSSNIFGLHRIFSYSFLGKTKIHPLAQTGVARDKQWLKFERVKMPFSVISRKEADRHEAWGAHTQRTILKRLMGSL